MEIPNLQSYVDGILENQALSHNTFVCELN